MKNSDSPFPIYFQRSCHHVSLRGQGLYCVNFHKQTYQKITPTSNIALLILCSRQAIVPLCRRGGVRAARFNKFGALGRECAHGAIWGYSEAISNGRLQLMPALNRHFRGLAPDSMLKPHSNFKPTFSRFGSRSFLKRHLRGFDATGRSSFKPTFPTS